MRLFSQTIFILILITGTCGVFHAHAPARAIKKSSVTGKVTMKGKGVVGISVGLRVSDYSTISVDSSYTGTTDEEGIFRINDVTPGTYQLVPLAPAFVSVGDAADGSFTFSNLAPGRYWPVVRAPGEVDQLTLTKIYRPDQVDNRARLRREAEAKKRSS